MKRKLFCILLSLMMVVTMMPFATMTAFADDITYIGDVLATNVNFPKSEDGTVPNDAWINENGIKIYIYIYEDKLMCFYEKDDQNPLLYCNLSGDSNYYKVVKLENGDYADKAIGTMIFHMSDGVLISIEETSYGPTNPWADHNGTYEPPKDNSKLNPLLIAAGITAAVATAATVAKVVDKTMYQVKVKSDKHGIVDQLTTINVGKEATITADGNKLKVGKLNTVKAIPARGYEFDQWVGIPENGVVSEDMTVTATFKAKEEKQEETAKTEPTLDEVKETVADVTIRCNTKKTGEGTEVYTTVTDGDLEALEAAGYTVTYKFYRSKYAKKNYKLMEATANSTYTDTTGTEGTMYYYKAKVVVTDKDGNEVAVSAIKDCKYGNRKF